MKNDTLSLREAAKLLQWAPATLKRRIKNGTVKASSTGKGRSLRYMISAKDLPKAGGNGSAPQSKASRAEVRVGRPAKRSLRVKAPEALLQAAGEQMLKQTRIPVGAKQQHFISEPFVPAQHSSTAEQALRQAFCGWVIEKVLAQ